MSEISRTVNGYHHCPFLVEKQWNHIGIEPPRDDEDFGDMGKLLVIDMGSTEKSYVLINYCPFCGTKLESIKVKTNKNITNGT